MWPPALDVLDALDAAAEEAAAPEAEDDDDAGLPVPPQAAASRPSATSSIVPTMRFTIFQFFMTNSFLR